MAPITKWLTLLVILSNFLKPWLLIEAKQEVPCMFVFGDSQFDNGNNNVLFSLAKTNYPPYGIDYPDGPTGRFTNGLTVPDVLAQLLGFQRPIPPFVTTNGLDLLMGVNYASGGAGILNETGMLLIDRVTMDRQLENHRTTITRIANLLLNNQTAVNDYMNKCLYVMSMGANDFLNNYYLPLSVFRLIYPPDRFADLLIQKFSQQLRALYDEGARKVAIFGPSLIGCIPHVVQKFPTNGAPCVDFINEGIQVYNKRVPTLIDGLNRELAGAHFTIINNVINGFSLLSYGDLSLTGIKVANESCCPVDRLTGLCQRNRAPCKNRNEYIFWDNFHPTEIVNRAMAKRAYTSALPFDVYPVDIQTLVRL